MYVSDLADESQHRLSMWQHVLGACIKHSQRMEEEHDVTAWWWQNGRKEEHSHALHGDEGGEECMRHGGEMKREA